MFVVCVQFNVKPDSLGAFLPLMRANAATSLETEPGCHRFDIAQDPKDRTRIFLYELYSDAAAFDAHLKSDHFASFNAATAEMVADKAVSTWTLLN